MACWYKWLLSAGLTAAGMTLVSGLIAFRPIETDVSARTAERLKAEGHGWAKLAISGRDLVLSGLAPDPEHRDLALAAADRVFGVRVVDDRSTVLPLAEPYGFSLERDGNKVVLAGTAPSEEARAALRASIARALPGVAIEDRLTLARGAPAGYLEAATFAFAELAGLKKGRIDVAAGAYSIVGDPVDWATWRKLDGELAAALPGGLKLAKNALVPPVPKPYRFSLTSGGGTVVLAGHLPDDAAKAKFLAALRSLWSGPIDDRVAIIPGAPAGFLDTLLAALPAIARLADGGLDLSDQSLKITGAAPTAPLADRIRAWLAGRLPTGFSLAGAEVAVVPPAAVAPELCRAGLSAVQANGKIRFATGSADLDTDDVRVLDGLVIAALRCGSARVVVEGHTDSVGDPAANMALSQRRAAAVLDYLVAAGIPADRLSAGGYGDTRPVADNESDQGRQINRRIDFTVE